MPKFSFPHNFFAIAAIPFANGLHAYDIDMGVFYITAVSSIGVAGILLAGWSSNNKYSLVGAMRSGAQIISYELSVGLSLFTIVILTGSLQFSVEIHRLWKWDCRIFVPMNDEDGCVSRADVGFRRGCAGHVQVVPHRST